MDVILETVKREITLDCTRGSSLDRVWSFMAEDSGVPADNMVYLWPYISSLDGLTFINGQSEHIFDPADDEKRKEFQALTFAQVASHDAEINRELLGRPEGVPRVMNSPKSFKVLELITVSTELGLDPRSSFHFIKVLEAEGMEGLNTNLIILRRNLPAPKKESKTRNHITIVDGVPVKKKLPNPGYERAPEEMVSNLVRFKLRNRISDILEQSESGSMAVGLDFYDRRHRKYFHRRVRMREIKNAEYEIPDEHLPRIPTTDGGKEDIDAEMKERARIKAAKAKRMTLIRQKKARRMGLELRRCVRFIKPVGVPLKRRREHDRAGSTAVPADGHTSQDEDENDDEDEDEDAALANDDDDDDDEMAGIEAVKEHADIKHLLSMPQVRMGMLSGMSLESQVFRLGTVAKAVQFILREHNYKTLVRVFDRLVKSPIVLGDGSLPGTYAVAGSANAPTQIPKTEMLITSVDEFLGREHRKRYFANPAATSLISQLLVDLGTEDNGARPQSLVSASATTSTAGKDMAKGKDREADVEVMPEEQIEAPTTNADSQVSASKDPVAPAHSGLHLSMPDLVRIAETESKSVNAILRQECLMVMLRDKGIVCCTKSTIKACQNRASLYVREREAAGEITSSVAASMVNYKMDKRTFLRTITTLASEQRVHHRAVAANPNKSRNLPMLSHLAIAWEIDPNGERVDAFIEALKDSMIINSAGLKLRLPPLVENSALVQRTTGSKERDRRYIDAKLGVARFRSTVATTRRKRFKRLAAEVESGVAYDSRDDGDDEPLYKRAKRENMRAGRTGKDPAWEEVKQEMEYLGGAMVRLQTLHQFLIKELPRSIDNIRVYPNYIFRIPYLLYALPLRLHIQLCKGAWYTHAAIRYVRYGIETEEQRETRLSAADEDEDELMARRLNTPIGKLPQDLIAMIMSKVNRSRVLMYILQLPDLTSDREPADAKDNQSTIGYQLIGKARVLNRKGYRCAPVSQDLSVNYLNDNVHNYWDELQTSSHVSHPLFRINSLLNRSQIETLDRVPPMAAKEACVSLPEARIFRRNIHIKHRKNFEESLKKDASTINMAKGTPPPPLNDLTPPRRRWSAEDQHLLILTFVVMPVLLMPALKVFPDRFDWGNMMHRDHYRSLSECLMTLWPHIFDDALSKGELTDTSNREKWDIVKEKNTLLEILEQYKEKLYYDYVDVADEQQPDLFDKLAELARRAQADNEPGQEHLQKHAKEKVKITLEEFKLRYVIVSKDAKPTYEFPEDSLRRGSNMHSTFQQLRMAKNTMYTMRQGWSCLADESNPVTTHLQLSDDGMPVKVPVSAYTPRLSIYPVVRILNARLVSNPVLVIGRLCMDRYVSSTRLRAIITNLYDESLANKLLLPDKYVSELLASNAMSVGLAKLPITWPSETQAESSVGSTVVVHETSGATRVGAAEARPGTHTAGEGGIERRAPGRGFAISERFATGPQQLPELSTADHHWAPADSAYSLSLFAQGRLWLRPVYSAKPDAPFGPMAGFQRRLNLHVASPMDVDGDQQHGGNLALSPEILEKVLSALAMLVHETGAMGVALGELQSLISRMFEKTTMDMPEHLRTILQSRSALQTLVGMLVSSKRLVVVGCTDQRYVSERYYQAQWMTTVGDPPLKLVPYLGQSLNGSANMALLLNMILEHPGISQTNLMRRHFAPHVAKAEIQRFLDILCSHKIIDKRESEVPANSGVYITTYRARLDYYSKLRQLSRSLGDLLPLDS
ncbi:hypothetical protein DL89DRAFT_266545 [Linderina pennispora]|uniref:B-block binding subunit of TFIIIC domain-containing protein n=1 Tax=Linderina pennispora TaxID=61395 RepID=A0A1Y1WDC9_9FUNG|nr:uncharacterized protein DL89DRAFT_266545 [Linderina pennispora]ORX71543.1 hypothetical protein DL89DRAFT_266545 [Linderina pennispora]